MRANKRLGQHFLVDPGVLDEIAAIADVGRSAGALEIGPGEGALTAYLLRSGRPVNAIEKDRRAQVELRERFGDQLNLVEGDALTADLATLLPPAVDGKLPVVVGNLPYNVGSAIYRRLLDLRGQVARLVLMLQREVAQRIVATPGSKAYGIPSVTTALVARAWEVLDVPPAAFRPRPKVHSSVILVEFLDPPEARDEELPDLDRFVGTVFRNRRKTVDKVLAELGLDPADFGVDPKLRAEGVAPRTLLAMFRAWRG